MKKSIIILLMLLTLIFPNQVLAISISARSACLIDTDSGRILYEKDKDTPRLIASITKIMTAILAIESEKLNEEVTVGEEVLTMYGSNIYIELGEKMTLLDLVYGLLLRSGNDSSVVIAKYVGGTIENFVTMMNNKAKEIGMKNTIFNNPHGLDEETENKSSAYDMALLSSYASKNETYMKIVGTKKYTVSSSTKSYLWYNRNKLLTSYRYATGGKTGYTPRAGRTLVTNASKNGLNLTAVTLNDGNEYTSHENMYEYAFENFKTYKILDKNHFSIDSNFYDKKVYIKKSFSYPLTNIEKEKIKVLVQITKQDDFNSDDVVGVVKVMLDKEEIYKDNIYIKIENKKKTIFDYIRSWFK